MKFPTSFVTSIVVALISVSTNESIKPFNDDLSMFDFKSKFKGHPFLYFDVDAIHGLQLVSTLSHKFLANDITQITNKLLHRDALPPKDYESFTSKWNEKYGNALPVLSIYCILNPEDEDVFNYVVEFMDRLSFFDKWYVKSAPTDDVPLAHILLGFVTSFDFLYTRFDRPRQLKYIRQIVNKTQEMYEMSNTKWWSKAYLQNHVFTNLVALLTASLVIEPYEERATIWKQHAVKLLERNMYLLGYVTDGTITESDHYHAYSTRSITQYVFLCKRHFQVDHTSHAWLKRAFWYYYGTVLPGMKEPVGFADSQPGWSYGYEANLFFLDRFVLRNGNANWLGLKIRQRNRIRTIAGYDSILSMHLEYIWYDPSLSPKAPSSETIPTLYKYPDMGVVTFRTATELNPKNTFLSFKSGKLHGTFINNLVNNKPKWLRGWKSFNPGHEQPDRNSFTFAPHGISMVTEGWKNHKYTYLDNTLMFKPMGVNIDSCVDGWIGQIGECSKYLTYNHKTSPGLVSNGEIVTSTFKDNVVHISGEAKAAYDPKLQLESFYRNILLLTPDVLVVIDHIQIGKNSPIHFVSSFMNNRYFSFTKSNDGSGKDYISLDDPSYADYKISWVLDDFGSTTLNITNNFISPMLASSKIDHILNNINITFEMKSEQKFKRIAYILHGPSSSVQSFLFTNTCYIGVEVELIVNNEKFKIAIPTKYRDPLSRQNFLNHRGFYSIYKNSSTVQTIRRIADNYSNKTYNANQVLSDNPALFKMPDFNSSPKKGRDISLAKYDHNPQQNNVSYNFTTGIDIRLMLRFLCVAFICSVWCYFEMREKFPRVFSSRPVRIIYVYVIFVVILFILIY